MSYTDLDYKDVIIARLQKENTFLKTKLNNFQRSTRISNLSNLGSDFGSEADSIASDTSNLSKDSTLEQINKNKPESQLKKNYDIQLALDANAFTYVKEIGKGSFGTVFLIHVNLKNNTRFPCALKTVTENAPIVHRESNIVEYFIKHPHPNIVPFYKTQCQILTKQQPNMQKFRYIFMKYVNHNLRDLLDNLWNAKAHMRKKVHKVIFLQFAHGLNHMHSHHICHRDLKPENILVDTKTLHLYICDFGCSKNMQNTTVKNTTYICSRFYRAPELIIDRNLYQYHIDVWSFGCIFIECCISQILFPGKDNVDMLIQHIRLVGNITEKDIRSMPSTVSESDQFPTFHNMPSGWTSLFQKKTFGANYESLCKSILCFNIDDRHSINQIISSKYFDNAGEICKAPYQNLKQTLNEMQNSD